MKRFPGIVAALALVVAASGGTAAVAASPPPPVPVRPVYLALGDSVAAGQNSEAPEDLDAYWRTVDKWKRNGYVTPFAKFLKHELDCLPESAKASERCGQLDVINLARSAVPGDPDRPGVTAQAVLDEQLVPAVELITGRNGDDNPRNDVKVITLTVGGNEIFDAFQEALRTGNLALIQQAMQTFGADYGQILATLRAADPDIPILTMTYFNPLGYCNPPVPPGQLPAVVAFADQVLELFEVAPEVYGFNGLIEAISTSFGAVPADTYGQLGEGDFFDCKHPNPDGYEDVTAAFEQAWEQLDS